MPVTLFKLLIIDDDEGDRKQIIRCIKRSGLRCECVEAETVKDALQLFEEVSFDCVILDYYIPGESGLNGIAAIHDRDLYLPVIMSTGQGSERVASEAIKLGAMDYVSKNDVTPDSIRFAVEAVVSSSTLKRKYAEQQAALAMFARVVVHDLKAPIQSILGFSKLLEAFLRQDNFDREKVLSQSRRIAEGALRMDAFLDQLHAYTEADSEPQFENLQLDDLLADVLANLDAVIGKARASVESEGLPVICGDRAQLIQLLQNLIGNGIKYCRADAPQVRIRACVESDEYCRVEICDNGIGIPEKSYKSVFEPFRRLHAQGEFEGTGLGLATCKKIVERHGGTIWCRSKAGKGTSFFFTVPLVRGFDESSGA